MLLTLVAVKILNEHYEDKITLWGLIERKAKAYCQMRLEISEQVLDVILEGVVACFDKVMIR